MASKHMRLFVFVIFIFEGPSDQIDDQTSI